MPTDQFPTVRLVILDRDGVINEDREDFVRCSADWVPIEGSLRAIERLNRRGILVAIATNQSGLARGMFALSDLDAIHQTLARELSELGGHVDGIFVCPHGPSEGCDCRKPRPGLLLQAGRTLGVRAEDTVFVGDRDTDLRAAEAASVQPILVRTGHGKSVVERAASRGIVVADDLASAIEGILCARDLE